MELEPIHDGLSICGEMTVYHAATLKPQLLAQLAVERAEFQLDLSQVTEFDTAGLQLLVMLWRRSEMLGRQLRVVGCSHAVREVLDLCHQGRLAQPAAEVCA